MTANKKNFFGTTNAVIVLGFARMADSLGNSFLIVVLPLYIASNNVTGELFSLSNSTITGLILALFGLISSFLQPLSGRWSDRAGKRKAFVIIGLVIFAIANFSYSFAHSYISLILIRSLQGLAAAFTITASVALVNEISEETNRGNNMGVYNTLRLVGFGAGPLLSGALIEGGPYTIPIMGEINGFLAAFAIAFGCAALSVILVALLVKDPKETKPNAKKVKLKFRSEEKGKWLDPIFALGLASFIMSCGFSILAPIETETNQRLSQGAFVFSIEFSAMIAALAVAQPIIGKASDKYGRRIFIIIGLCCLIPVTLAQGLVTTSWQMIVARALQGISAAMVLAPSLALAGDIAKKGESGAKLSVLTMAFGLGISFGSFMSGYVVGFGYFLPFALASFLAIFAVIIVKTQVPKNKPETTSLKGQVAE